MKARQDFDSEKDWQEYLRYFYAGQIIQGLMANPERYKYITDLFARREVDHEGATQKNAHKAVKMTDALIAELNKGENK